jgi:hypothetical protein
MYEYVNPIICPAKIGGMRVSGARWHGVATRNMRTILRHIQLILLPLGQRRHRKMARILQ